MLENIADSKIGRNNIPKFVTKKDGIYFNGKIECYNSKINPCRGFTSEEILGRYNWYEKHLRNYDLWEVKHEEKDQKYPREWLDNVARYLMDNGDKELSSWIRHIFCKWRGGFSKNDCSEEKRA